MGIFCRNKAEKSGDRFRLIRSSEDSVKYPKALYNVEIILGVTVVDGILLLTRGLRLA